MSPEPQPVGESAGMSQRLARSIEYGIIGLCLVSMGFLFQPYSLRLYGIGALLAVVGGLAFNLVPQCVPGRPLRAVLKVAGIVLAVLAVAVILAVVATLLYIEYLKRR